MKIPEILTSTIENYENVILNYSEISPEIIETIETLYFLRDEAMILELNTAIREEDVEWTEEITKWPDSYFVIGEDGCGNFYYLDLSNNSVGFYDHEKAEFEHYANNLVDYANKTATWLQRGVVFELPITKIVSLEYVNGSDNITIKFNDGFTLKLGFCFTYSSEDDQYIFSSDQITEENNVEDKIKEFEAALKDSDVREFIIIESGVIIFDQQNGNRVIIGCEDEKRWEMSRNGDDVIFSGENEDLSKWDSDYSVE